MKKTRRIAAFIAAMAMAATMAVPSFVMTASAADNTIMVTKGETNIAPEEMAAYQIFTGTDGTADGKLNVTGWGSGINADTFLAALKADTTIGSDFESITYADSAGSAECAVAVAGVIAGYSSENAKAEAVARIALANKKGTGTGTWSKDDSKITGVADGYYVVADTKAEKSTDPVGETYTLALLKVAGGSTVNVTTKVNLPTFTKQIADVDDSTTALVEETAGKYDKHAAWSTDADYDIEDSVPFLLTATLPGNYNDYLSYKMVFHDDLQADVFSFHKDSVKVYYGSDLASATELSTSLYTVSTTASVGNKFAAIEGKTDGTEDFTVTIANLKATGMPAFTSTTKFFVTYTAELTEKAVIGSAGNWNNGYLEYSNNPNYTGSGTEDTDNTPQESVVAFTYQTNFDKIDGVTQQALEGAKFVLYKIDKNAAVGATSYDTSEDAVDKYKNKGYVLVGNEQESTIASPNTKATFGWKGLDDGQYLLVETAVPTSANGTYKKIDPIEFSITPEHSAKALIKLNDQASTGAIDITGLVNDEGTATVSDGSISGTIANTQSTTLPSTGGIGTVLFYTVGGVLVVGAGVVLISKKRAKDVQ